MKLAPILLSTLLALAAAPALSHSPAHGHGAHGGHSGHGGHGTHGAGPVKKEQTDWGIAGDRRDARRTIEVGMGDDMRFRPDRIEVRVGETVRFVVKNHGRQMHEFVIGTKAENAKHAELMLKHPGMEHDAPYMAHVEPGKSGEIVWTFNRAGEFEFACLIAGHFQAGMVGTIQVATGAPR
jgi:uncharacterized cupredoxin-like copper-binding protein